VSTSGEQWSALVEQVPGISDVILVMLHRPPSTRSSGGEFEDAR
jgi:hypothetical protein